MSTLIHQRVEQARAGENPFAICRVTSGWVVAGDVQHLEGYCLLLPDPVVSSLNELRGTARAQFLTDMVAIGDALLEITGVIRINYDILGNLEPALHAHVFPRRASEPEELRTKPAFFYDWTMARRFDPSADAWWVERVRSSLTD